MDVSFHAHPLGHTYYREAELLSSVGCTPEEAADVDECILRTPASRTFRAAFSSISLLNIPDLGVSSVVI